MSERKQPITFEGWRHRLLGVIRKAQFFPFWKTGQETARGRGLLRPITRVRQELTRTARAIFFPLHHTGAEPPQPDIKLAQFKSRVRETLTHTARATLWPTFRTAAEALGTLQLKLLRARFHQITTRLARAQFWQIFAPPLAVPEVNINVIRFLARHRLSYAHAGVRMIQFMPTFQHFEPPAPPVVMRSWVGVSLASHSVRGGH